MMSKGEGGETHGHLDDLPGVPVELHPVLVEPGGVRGYHRSSGRQVHLQRVGQQQPRLALGTGLQRGDAHCNWPLAEGADQQPQAGLFSVPRQAFALKNQAVDGPAALHQPTAADETSRSVVHLPHPECAGDVVEALDAGGVFDCRFRLPLLVIDTAPICPQAQSAPLFRLQEYASNENAPAHLLGMPGQALRKVQGPQIRPVSMIHKPQDNDAS